ncbi:hypothetical protein ABIF38_005225 [Bradyrhizobium japonicum]|nr:hypothetical protein [Bradyrhizobium elkanii]MCS3567802.1 hypothetical protein [Bradyrhizobium elkanii]MCS3590715.1 hypothetical protein [Bradyrhizobium elkanii]MCS3620158.1 hypothetical protein [Bradyrhizobium elkanii]
MTTAVCLLLALYLLMKNQLQAAGLVALVGIVKVLP